MADTDVTVSMGDVVMVKGTEEEDDPDDPSRTQVILQLQPITPGYVEDTGMVSGKRYPFHGLVRCCICDE